MPKSKELELSPIPKSTDSLNVYDWNAIHRKLLQSKSFYELKLIAENEFVGDKSLSGDTIDNVPMKFFPADTPQQFLCPHAVITGEDGNSFCRSIRGLYLGLKNIIYKFIAE